VLQGRGIDAAVWDPIWLKPLAVEEIVALGERSGSVVTLEEGSLAGGFGEEVCRIFSGSSARVRALGLPDSFQPHGPRQELLREAGLDCRSVVEAVEAVVGGKEGRT